MLGFMEVNGMYRVVLGRLFGVKYRLVEGRGL